MNNRIKLHCESVIVCLVILIVFNVSLVDIDDLLTSTKLTILLLSTTTPTIRKMVSFCDHIIKARIRRKKYDSLFISNVTYCLMACHTMY